MAEYICPGGVADVYVEYHGEEDSEDSRSGSDFEEHELMLLMSDDEPERGKKKNAHLVKTTKKRKAQEVI
jgi:hypothetical protein